VTTLRYPPIDAWVTHLQRRFDLDTLIETGTFQGESTLWAAERFRRVVTVDCSLEFQDDALASCAEHSNVEFLTADTRLALPRILASLDGPALCWLDAHATPGLFGVQDDWPALEELQAIAASPHQHFILVDDAHCFLPGTPYPACPSIEQVIEVAGAGGYAWRINHDVIALVPNRHVMELVKFGDPP
jgi:hypothetical protein